jgi:hypothetical protein
MQQSRLRFTLRQLMVAVLLAGGASWFKARVWDREYTETGYFSGWPAWTRATYTRTYGDRLLERLGVRAAPFRNWTPIPDPPSPPPPPSAFRMPQLSDWIPTTGPPPGPVGTPPHP